MQAAGLSSKTVKHIRDVLRAVLNVAVNDWELINRTPASRAKPPDSQPPKLNVLDIAHARSFLERVAGHRLEALFSIALCLGRAG